MSRNAAPAFASPDAFRGFLRRLPPGFEFASGSSLVACPLAVWARRFEPCAAVACSHVAWDGSFGGPRVERLTWWQEDFARRAMLHALQFGGGVSAAAAVEILERVVRPGAVRIGPATPAGGRRRA